MGADATVMFLLKKRRVNRMLFAQKARPEAERVFWTWIAAKAREPASW
jgi:hypothetical protein